MQGLTSIERECVERATAAQDEMLRRTLAWATINSGSRNLVGLASVGSAIGDALAALPGELRWVEPTPVEAIDEAGKIFELPHGRHLRLTVRPRAPLQLLFTGHMDTVFPADHPFQQSRFLDDSRIVNGPGAADMKGGIAVMLAALEAVEAEGAALFGYDIVINSDEEVGSLSSAALLSETAQGKRAALTYEPAALPDGTLAGARPGSGNFDFTITGRSAHAGRNPEDGRNALLAAADLALRLKQGVGPGLSVNPARIDGGSPNNVVPDLAILRVNMRPSSTDDQARAHSLIDREVGVVAAAHDVAIHVHGHFARPPKPISNATQHLFDIVKQAGTDLGQSIDWKATGGVCDGNNIAACGIPVIDTMGVRGGMIHSMEEYLIVESLAERAALSALTILRLAGEAS
jgi:glutamate carboxypeptidase